MSHFAKGNGENNHKKDHQLALSSDDEDDKGSGGETPLLRVMPEPDSKRQQQLLSPASADDRVPQGGFAGLVTKRPLNTTSMSSSSSSMTFSDALNKAKAVDEAEKAREGDTAPHAQAAAASQPCNAQEDDEDDEAELRMPGSSDFGLTDHGPGGACETPGAGTVDLYGSLFPLYMWLVQILPYSNVEQ